MEYRSSQGFYGFIRRTLTSMDHASMEERMIEWTGWTCRWSVYQQFTGFPLLFCINDISHLWSCENKSVVTKSSLHIIFTLNFEELLNFKWFQLPQSSLYVIIVIKSIVSKGDWAVHKRCQNGSSVSWGYSRFIFSGSRLVGWIRGIEDETERFTQHESSLNSYFGVQSLDDTDFVRRII